MSYVCSNCKTTGSRIGSVTPHHYSYLAEDREKFDWLCDRCATEYKKQYYIRFILVDIESIIAPHKVNSWTTGIFTEAVEAYCTSGKTAEGHQTELDIYDKVFRFLDSMCGSLIYCKYGSTENNIYGISTIGFISNKPAVVDISGIQLTLDF